MTATIKSNLNSSSLLNQNVKRHRIYRCLLFTRIQFAYTKIIYFASSIMISLDLLMNSVIASGLSGAFAIRARS